MKTKKSDFLKVAYISKTRGIKGELFLRPFHSQADWPPNLKNIFIGDSLSPFSVKKYKQVKGGWIFALNAVSAREEGEKLKSKAVFLPKKQFQTKKGEFVYLAELRGFHIETSEKTPVGTIHSFQSGDFQDFLLVKTQKDKSEVLIPFVKAYIRNIDFKTKKLIVNLPKNFLEIFTYKK